MSQGLWAACLQSHLYANDYQIYSSCLKEYSLDLTEAVETCINSLGEKWLRKKLTENETQNNVVQVFLESTLKQLCTSWSSSQKYKYLCIKTSRILDATVEIASSIFNPKLLFATHVSTTVRSCSGKYGSFFQQQNLQVWWQDFQCQK